MTAIGLFSALLYLKHEDDVLHYSEKSTMFSVGKTEKCNGFLQFCKEPDVSQQLKAFEKALEVLNHAGRQIVIWEPARECVLNNLSMRMSYLKNHTSGWIGWVLYWFRSKKDTENLKKTLSVLEDIKLTIKELLKKNISLCTESRKISSTLLGCAKIEISQDLRNSIYIMQQTLAQQAHLKKNNV
jgi:hypothetical protein